MPFKFDKDLVTKSVTIFKYQLDHPKMKNLNLSSLIRDLLDKHLVIDHN